MALTKARLLKHEFPVHGNNFFARAMFSEWRVTKKDADDVSNFSVCVCVFCPPCLCVLCTMVATSVCFGGGSQIIDHVCNPGNSHLCVCVCFLSLFVSL